MPLISCEVSLELKWNKNCVIASLKQRQVDAGPPVVRDGAPTGATLAINDCKLYIPVVTLSKDDEIKLLTNLKSVFTREIEWNKYRSQMTTEAINNNLNILTDHTFTNVNRLFVLAYQTADDRQSFSQFYIPKVMVKDFNVIIDKLVFTDLPIKTEEEAYEKIIDISRNNEYTTGNLLDYDYDFIFFSTDECVQTCFRMMLDEIICWRITVFLSRKTIPLESASYSDL